jgi:hypothetical protein
MRVIYKKLGMYSRNNAPSYRIDCEADGLLDVCAIAVHARA